RNLEGFRGIREGFASWSRRAEPSSPVGASDHFPHLHPTDRGGGVALADRAAPTTASRSRESDRQPSTSRVAPHRADHVFGGAFHSSESWRDAIRQAVPSSVINRTNQPIEPVASMPTITGGGRPA